MKKWLRLEPEEALIEKVIEEVAEPEETPQVEEVVEAEQEIEVQLIEEVAKNLRIPETEVQRDASRRRKCEKAAWKTRDIGKEIEAELEKQAAELEKQEKLSTKRKGRKKKQHL